MDTIKNQTGLWQKVEVAKKIKNCRIEIKYVKQFFIDEMGEIIKIAAITCMNDA